MFAAPKPSPHPVMAPVPPHMKDLSSLPLQDPPTTHRQASAPTASTSEPVVVESPTLVDDNLHPEEEQHASPTSSPAPVWNPDRPARTRQPARVYDAESGTYKDRTF